MPLLIIVMSQSAAAMQSKTTPTIKMSVDLNATKFTITIPIPQHASRMAFSLSSKSRVALSFGLSSKAPCQFPLFFFLSR